MSDQTVTEPVTAKLPSGGGGGEGDVKKLKRRLFGLINDWKDAWNKIQSWKDEPDWRITHAAELGRLQNKMERWSDRIENILDINPDLEDEAESRGWGLGTQGPGMGGGGGDEDREGQGGGGGAGAGANQGGNDGGGGGGGGGGETRPGGPAGSKLLPGIKNQDFHVVILGNGDRGAVYQVCVRKGDCADIMVRIDKKDIGKYGIKETDGRRMTKAQLKRIEEIGTVDELQPFFRGDEKDPFKALGRMLRRSYAGTDVLEDDEVLGTIIAQHVFGWSDAEFQNQLRLTKWYKNTNEWQRHWDLDLKKDDRRSIIQDYTEQVTDSLENMYGLNWVKHVKGGMKQVREWAHDIASGRWGAGGDPNAGFSFWESRQLDIARGIEGTPAYISQEQEDEARRAYKNRPEDMYEELRGQALQWLGPKAVPDDRTLRKWANLLAYEKRSDGDWMRFIRRQQQAHHGAYLDEDTPWQDYASAYKNAAEQELGTPIDWDDPLLWDFSVQEIGGKAARQPAIAMSMWDFMDRVRNDDRFDQSDNAKEQAASLSSALLSRFGGPG